MNSPETDRQAHWSKVYATKSSDSVSWYRPHLDVSLELLQAAGLAPESRVIDVGGGASTLVDDLLGRGIRRVTVLEISAEAVAVSKARLGPRAREVEWIVSDVLEARLAPGAYDLWHDRAVLHFLVDPADAVRYVQQCSAAVRPGGHAVIAGFAPDGPERCSGLPVVRRSAEDIGRLFADGWRLVAQRAEQHLTPAGAPQSFAYALLQRT